MTVAQGFAENYPVTHEILSVMKMFAIVKNTQCFLARIDGRVVGGATLAVRGRIAGLFGASTLPEFRNRGVQTALLHTRLRSAAEAHCELAVSLAQPGSRSQRNITRLGFQTLYTRVKFERAVPRPQLSFLECLGFLYLTRSLSRGFDPQDSELANGTTLTRCRKPLVNKLHDILC